jgi:hypothetical protein
LQLRQESRLFFDLVTLITASTAIFRLRVLWIDRAP